jgi:hypothetical protein
VNGDKLIRAAMTVVVVAVAGFAAVVSYSHIYDLGRCLASRSVPSEIDRILLAVAG